MGQAEKVYTFLIKVEKRSWPEHADSIERDFYGVSGLKKVNGESKVKSLSLIRGFKSHSFAKSWNAIILQAFL